MDRGTRNLFALGLVLVIAITGGAALVLGSGSGPNPTAPAPTGAAGSDVPAATFSAQGVIVAIDSAGLNDVEGFTLREDGGGLLDFTLALDDPTRFPPGHLAEHQATADPVVVWYRIADGASLAVRVDDAR